MPSDHKSNARSTSGTGILVVEEYDALAAALTSALKKFAPRHEVNVAPSIAAAKAMAKAEKPALLIIDFDPPFSGLTDFLYEMRDVCPEARVLVMGPKVPKEIAVEFRSLGSLHFVAKPFDILDFGASVQALLSDGPIAEAMRSSGSLASLGLADVVLAQCAGGWNIVLTVRGKGQKSGEIHLSSGQITHATAGKRREVDALAEMFAWSDPEVHEEKKQAGNRTIEENWTEVFLDAVRRANTRRPAQATAPSEPEPSPAKTGKKIVVIDDTDMLLVFVEDALLLADPHLQITTAASGAAGVKEVQRVLPDLVLLDYSLPDINGDEVCLRLLENNATAGIPILMMSGHVPEMTVAAEMMPNIVATISKPFLSEALIALVQQTLKTGVRPRAKISRPPEPARPEPVAPRPPQIPKAVEHPRPQPMPEPVMMEKPLAPEIERATPPRQVESPPPMVARQIQAAQTGVLSAPAITREGKEVVLGLFLQVVSMQLTPSLRMGAIRAKPSSLTVSLHVSPAALRAALPVEMGFELGRVDLDANGRLATVRLIPTLKAFQPQQTRNALQIGALDVVPHDSREHVQLTPSQSAPMMMHLLAHLEVAGVELSTDFKVSQIILRNRSSAVRVTLNSEAVGQEQTGVFCDTAAVHLDSSGRIIEMLLKPLK